MGGHQFDFQRNAGQWTPEQDHPDMSTPYTGLSGRELCTRCDGTGFLAVYHDTMGSGQPIIEVCTTGENPKPCSRHTHHIIPCDECSDGDEGD